RSARLGSRGNSTSIRRSWCSSTRPGPPRTWRANAAAVGAVEGCAPPFPTAITKPSRLSLACAFPASWRKRPSTDRSTPPRSRNGWRNASRQRSRKATSWSWIIYRATRDPRSRNSSTRSGPACSPPSMPARPYSNQPNAPITSRPADMIQVDRRPLLAKRLLRSSVRDMVDIGVLDPLRVEDDVSPRAVPPNRLRPDRDLAVAAGDVENVGRHGEAREPRPQAPHQLL